MSETCTPQAHAPTQPGTGDCPTCDLPRCNGTTKTGRCRKQPIKAATVCRTHGGSAPQVRDAAAARIAERQALQALEAFGVPVEVDPHTALLQELHRTAGAVAWLTAQVQVLEVEDLTWGKTREQHGTQLEKGVDNGVTFTAGVNALVDLWQRERKHLVAVSKTCLDVGIEERRVRLAESTGQQLASVVRSVLDRLELSDAQKILALSVVPDEFRRLGEVVAGAVVS